MCDACDGKAFKPVLLSIGVTANLHGNRVKLECKSKSLRVQKNVWFTDSLFDIELYFKALLTIALMRTDVIAAT